MKWQYFCFLQDKKVYKGTRICMWTSFLLNFTYETKESESLCLIFLMLTWKNFYSVYVTYTRLYKSLESGCQTKYLTNSDVQLNPNILRKKMIKGSCKKH